CGRWNGDYAARYRVSPPLPHPGGHAGGTNGLRDGDDLPANGGSVPPIPQEGQCRTGRGPVADAGVDDSARSEAATARGARRSGALSRATARTDGRGRRNAERTTCRG